MKNIDKTKSITEFMHRHIQTIDVSATSIECAELIAQERIGCLIVVNKGKPAGIITERSFVELVQKKHENIKNVLASDFMSKPLITINASANFSKAIEIFNKKEIKRIPVIENEKVIGLLTLKNMIEFSNLVLSKMDEEYKILEDKFKTDELTKVYTKSTITKIIQNENNRIGKYGGRSSILFIDIDHFKKINDKYSHLAGDMILKRIGRILKSVSKEIDSVGRFGGEEFIIMTPNRKKYNAVKFGEKLRKRIEKSTFTYNKEKIKITISIGIASIFGSKNYNVAIKRADKALYYAKNMGRNKIALWRNGKIVIALEDKKTQQEINS